MIDPNVLLAFALIASLISGIIGFGSAIIFISLGSLFFPIKSVIFLGTVFFLAMNASKIMLYAKAIQGRLATLIILAGLPGTYLGAKFMVTSDPAFLQKILGGIILLYVIWASLHHGKIKKISHFVVAGGSFVYGLVAGAIGTGSVIKVMILDRIGLRKEAFVGTMAVTAGLSNVIKLWVYSSLPLAEKNEYGLMAALVVIAFLGTWLGRHVLRKLTPEAFQKLVLGALFLIALRLLIL